MIQRGQVKRQDSELQTVVITFSMCCEYWQDLWDLGPLLLWANPADDSDFLNAVSHAVHGSHPVNYAQGFSVREHERSQQRYLITPGCTSPLGATERRVLRYLAEGYRNETIAQRLNLHTKTVLNISSDIYRKLHLENRMEALLYYWDMRVKQEEYRERVCRSTNPSAALNVASR